MYTTTIILVFILTYLSKYIFSVTPMDYYYYTRDTVFPSEAKNTCMRPECVNIISIMNDLMVEMDESFHVSLEIFDIDQQDRDKFELCSGDKYNCSRLVDIVMITIKDNDGVTL